jgi:soluble cytochrome b562
MSVRIPNARLGRKNWLVMLAAVAVLASLSVGRWAPVVRGDDDDDSPVAKEMKKINDGYKALRRSARSGTYDDDSLTEIVKMQQAAITAKMLEPPMLKKIPADKKKAFLAGYHKTMAKLIIQMAQIEIALIDGKTEDATKGIENLALIKKEGHDNYTEE